MSRYLPAEIRGIIYSYISNVQTIEALLASSKDRTWIKNCVIALLTSKLPTVSVDFVLQLPNLTTVNVPIRVDHNANAATFAHIPHLSLSYNGHGRYDDFIPEFLHQYYQVAGSLANKYLRFIKGMSLHKIMVN